MAENALPPEITDRSNKASMAINKKNYDYAIELLNQVINIKPDYAKGRQLLRLAEIKKFDNNTPNIIIRLLNRFISYIFAFTAMVYEQKGDHHAAMALYEKILRTDPKYVRILARLGNLLKIDGMEKASAVTLEAAAAISEKNPFVYELLGEIYSSLGNYDRARYCFKKVLELKPNDADAERGLKNLDALTTIDRSFEKRDGEDFRIREITE